MNRSLASGPIVWLGIIVTTCLLLVLFQTMLWLVLPLLLGVVTYYMLSPLVNIAIARGMTRARAVFIVTALLSVFLAAIALIVAPKISRASSNWKNMVVGYAESGVKLIANAQTTLEKMVPYLHRPATPPDAEKAKSGAPAAAAADEARENAVATEALDEKVAAFTENHSGDVALELARWIPSLLLVPYITYFFLLDGPRFKRFLVRAIPNAFFEKTLYLFYRVEDQMRRYFQGLLALTALDALCLGTGLWFLGLHAPFFLAIMAAVMAWLPYLGSIGGALLAALVAASDFPDNHWLPYEVLGLFIGVRLLDDFVFLPLTVGRSLRMHPLVTVLMILLGGAVAGISGLLLVMPVLGVVMVAGQIIGELVTDQRILARHRHARHLQRQRAHIDLFTG
ncbi:MAG TPA: AI-2E family transporter [Candidatus Methylacidiphilales bacterium]|jgi:predicted PurR-regulated permease PerM|nr:AI-2E family transporter [Candidatus Methylacidiphilales bacterium]